jgi:HEPN domain-containing protein
MGMNKRGASVMKNAMKSLDRSRDWLAQAKNDLLFAKSALADGFFSQCCFIAQQAAEKALKSRLLRTGARLVFTHSLVKLCQALEINGDLRQAAGILDQYYLSGRYPDALPGGAPFEAFSQTQARQAVRFAAKIIRACGAKKRSAVKRWTR